MRGEVGVGAGGGVSVINCKNTGNISNKLQTHIHTQIPVITKTLSHTNTKMGEGVGKVAISGT